MLGLTLREEFRGKHFKGTLRHRESLVVDEKTIYRLAQQGKLPGLKVAGTWRFQLQDIQGWIDERKEAVKARKTKAA